MSTPAQARFGVWLERAPFIYLGLPALVFLGGWIVPAIGIPAVIALAFALVRLMPRGPSTWVGPSRNVFVALAVFALVWTVLGGTGHFVYGNFDWIVRDAVLSDLVRNPWPVVYASHTSDELRIVAQSDVVGPLLLRAPIGFYLPAAIVGKISTVVVADYAEMAWISLGVLLTLLLMLRDAPSPRALVVRVAVFVLFSGMDIVGETTHLKPNGLGAHLEWWAYAWQYSSTTTQLFWAPNHALPAWIVTAWFLGRRGDLPIASAIALTALLPLWSPLAAIGIVPFLVLEMTRAALRDGFAVQMRMWTRPALLLCVAIHVVLVYPYLVLGAATVPSGFIPNLRWVGEDFVPRYIEFVLIEFGLFAALLVWRLRRDAWLWTAIAVLLVLPFFWFGPANDLAMRSSIPALMVLAIRIGDWLTSATTGRDDRVMRFFVVVLLAIGAVTPFYEVVRAFQLTKVPFDTRHDLIDVARREAPHYLTARDHPWADRFLRAP